MQHLDEGTIHAWLDGALVPNEASAAEAHVQSCAACANAVAEARGLIAASSRILSALDDIPAVQQPLTFPARGNGRKAWWRRTGVGYAAAATMLLAVGTTLVWSRMSPNEALQDAAAPVAAGEFSRQPDVSVLESIVPPPTVAQSAANRPGPGGALGPQVTSLARSKNVKEREQAKEELAVDPIVPLPGAMPRPAAPPPGVRQEERKALAEVAADASARGAVVQGRVLDAATGAPIVGAVVSVDTARVATDEQGKFKLQQAPLGQQTVSVRALGFQPAQHQVAVAPSDSVDLGFALKKAAADLQAVATSGAAARRAEPAQSRDSLPVAQRTATPTLRLDGVRANAANILGCYTLRTAPQQVRDQDRARETAIPARVQLEAQPRERAEGNERLANRARTLEGNASAESWRFVGDSLELTWIEARGARRVARFGRDDVRWVGPAYVLERCDPQR